MDINNPGESNSRTIFAIIALAVLIIAGAAWWYSGLSKEESIIVVPEPIKTSEDVTEAVTVPEIEVGSNPVQNKVPEVNPVDRANPFKDAYQNPFE